MSGKGEKGEDLCLLPDCSYTQVASYEWLVGRNTC